MDMHANEQPAAHVLTGLDNATDRSICGVLAATAPLTSGEIARALGTSERTIRYRLRRLRESGALEWGSDGRYRLAAPAVPPPSEPTAPDTEDTPRAAGPRSGHRTGGAVPVVVLAAGIAAALAAVIWRVWGAASPAPAPAPEPAAPAPWPYGTDAFGAWGGYGW